LGCTSASKRRGARGNSNFANGSLCAKQSPLTSSPNCVMEQTFCGQTEVFCSCGCCTFAALTVVAACLCMQCINAQQAIQIETLGVMLSCSFICILAVSSTVHACKMHCCSPAARCTAAATAAVATATRHWSCCCYSYYCCGCCYSHCLLVVLVVLVIAQLARTVVAAPIS
jgi:hypothetical protein